MKVQSFNALPITQISSAASKASPGIINVHRKRINNGGVRFSQNINSLDETQTPEVTLASIPSKFQPLFTQAAKATVLKEQDTTSGAHDAFRYEWGTWVNDEELKSLMSRVDEVRVAPGAYDKLLAHWADGDENKPMRFKIAHGERWDCILHALPSSKQYEGRWPTGSWAVLKALTGVAEVAMLRQDRDGNFKKMPTTKKDLRGGSDGSLGLGSGGGGKGKNALPANAMGGEDCIKYVGGPLRCYSGKSQRTLLLELVIRPPSTVVDATMNDNTMDWPAEKMDEILDIYIPEPEVEEEQDEEENSETKEHESAQTQAQNLGKKLGMDFEMVGGLDAQLDTIVRRVLASRANPEAARRLGISHVRGILLSGPPGCGKTLLARGMLCEHIFFVTYILSFLSLTAFLHPIRVELARLLGAREPQIVNGPEIL